jgi:hypothetical protein
VSRYSSLRSRIGDGWAIYNFLPERLPVNEQKVDIFILLLNKVFSARTAACLCIIIPDF